MADLYWAVGFMTALAVGAFVFSAWGSRSLSHRVCDVLSLATLLALFIYSRYIWQNPRLAGWLPVCSLVVLGNWFLPLMGFLSGLVWRRVPGGVPRKLVSLVALLCTGMYATVSPLLGEPPLCRDVWDHGICVQTTRKTCSAACAATLLTEHGIPATEQEMAELCLTREGTTWQGLYRGLSLKTRGTRWKVDVVQCDSSELASLASSPMILSVGLESDSRVDREYQTEWGWTPGVRHSVLLRRFTRTGVAEIADPTPDAAFEQWSPEMLQVLWRGTAVRLVERGD